MLMSKGVAVAGLGALQLMHHWLLHLCNRLCYAGGEGEGQRRREGDGLGLERPRRPVIHLLRTIEHT